MQVMIFWYVAHFQIKQLNSSLLCACFINHFFYQDLATQMSQDILQILAPQIQKSHKHPNTSFSLVLYTRCRSFVNTLVTIWIFRELIQLLNVVVIVYVVLNISFSYYVIIFLCFTFFKIQKCCLFWGVNFIVLLVALNRKLY